MNTGRLGGAGLMGLRRAESRIASHWRAAGFGDRVQCRLCPRHCSPNPYQYGFCGVRGNLNGELHTYNFGLGLPLAVEPIETEAVYHYHPGARVLAVGNVGCMLDCSFCQNWRTSQIEHLDFRNTCTFTPQEIVDSALSLGVEIISWTYNDPVVWHEFVVETAGLARNHGLLNLYKSSLYIESAPLCELLDVIDIFSVSLKSMSVEFYSRHTGGGDLEPVLNAIKAIHKAPGRHLEISQLVVTDLNDDGSDALRTAEWMIENHGRSVPLHFAGFHPAYKYTDVPRTPVVKLAELRRIALDAGLEHVYVGNAFAGRSSDTFCAFCGGMIIERYGLVSHLLSIEADGRCSLCGSHSGIVLCPAMEKSEEFAPQRELFHEWKVGSNSIHVTCSGKEDGIFRLRIERVPSGEPEYYSISGKRGRLAISKKRRGETGVKIGFEKGRRVAILRLLDRAHYPVE